MCTYTEAIRDEGRLEMLFKLVSKGKLVPEDACEELGITLNELEEKMEDANFQFPRHYK